MIQEAISKLVQKHDLAEAETEQVMEEIMEGKSTDAQIAGFLVALRLKGETIDEITACAKIMRQKAFSISPKIEFLVDTCGTGGDKSHTFNISTVIELNLYSGVIPEQSSGILMPALSGLYFTTC